MDDKTIIIQIEIYEVNNKTDEMVSTHTFSSTQKNIVSAVCKFDELVASLLGLKKTSFSEELKNG